MEKDKRAYYERLKTYEITDYAKDLGFTVKRKGARYFTLKEHDSVIIDPVKNCFWRNSTGECGSVIDFGLCFTASDLQEVLQYLDSKTINRKLVTHHQKDPQVQVSKIVKLALPKADKEHRNVFAYLLKKRGIDAKVISELMHKRMIYRDEHKNCMFVSYKDGVPVFACRRGTNTCRPFYGDVAGCDYSFLFFIDNDADSLSVTESVIDTLSVMSLLVMDGRGPADHDYLALAGARKFEDALKYHLDKKEYKEIILSLDADEAGKKATEDIKELLIKLEYKGNVFTEYPEHGKDKNEELIYRKERKLWDE